MKRISVLILLLLLCAGLLAGCVKIGPPPESTAEPTTEPKESVTETESTPTEPTEPEPSQNESLNPDASMEALQQRMQQEDALCAVAYLGSVPGNFVDVTAYLQDYNLTETLPFLKEITSDEFVEVEGTELYLVIPREDMSITIYEQQMDWDTGELYWGYSLYVSFEPQPVLMRGNVSDIVTNMCIFLEAQSGASLEYAPCISLESGKLSAAAGVLDLTPYNQLEGLSDLPWDESQDLRVGTWYASCNDAAGEPQYLTMTLQADGMAYYDWGYNPGEIMESYSGSWYEREDQIVLELYGGMQDAAEMQHSLYCVFEWEYQNNYLILHHVDAACLVMGMENDWFYFVPENDYVNEVEYFYSAEE